MTTPPRRAAYRPVRDTQGFPCPQLYITQYVHTNGAVDLVVRADWHRSDGAMGGAFHVYSVPLTSPWECQEGEDHPTLEDVLDYVRGWMIQWFGSRSTLPLPGGWDRGPEA